MSEIRRKLVIVGDGACGKVCCCALFKNGAVLTNDRCPFIFTDLSVDCVFQGNVPRGMSTHRPLSSLRGGRGGPTSHPATINHPKTVTDSVLSIRCTFPQCSRTTSPMSRSMESTLSSLYGIQLDRRTMTVSDPSATPTHTSFLSVSPSTPQIPLITSRRRCVSSPSCPLCIPSSRLAISSTRR